MGEKVADDDLEAEPVFALPEDKYDTPLIEGEYKLEVAAADPVATRSGHAVIQSHSGTYSNPASVTMPKHTTVEKSALREFPQLIGRILDGLAKPGARIDPAITLEINQIK
jgi:hypothetical protein